MDPNTIMQLVSNLGFPIIMVGVLVYYIYTVMNPLVNAISEMTKAIDEILDRLDDLEHNQEHYMEGVMRDGKVSGDRCIPS